MPHTTAAVLPTAGSQPEDLFPRPMIFAGEDPALYEDLRKALHLDLAPSAPYERALVDNLVALEWEIHRRRRMRDDLIRAEARELAVGVYATGAAERVENSSDEDLNLGFDLVGSDPERAAAARAALQESDITPSEIFAKAYCGVADQVERHEKQLAALEVRRRRLREEYDRLRALRRLPIEDAEILE